MTDTSAVVSPTAISHVRLTVTDIKRSRAFYPRLLGHDLAFDVSSDRVDEPGVREEITVLGMISSGA